MNGNNRNFKVDLHFRYLPAFADFILKNKLKEFTAIQLDLMFEVDFPLLKLFDLSKYSRDELIELSIPSYTEYLQAAANNKLLEHLEKSIQKWESNQIPNINRDQLVIDDLTLVTYIRKKAFLEFIPHYTSNVTEIIQLIKELDDYTLEAGSQSFYAYISIHKERMTAINQSLLKHEEELLEAQEIACLGSFEWDLTGQGNSRYTPQVFKIFEMDKESTLSDFLNYVHPSDRQKVQDTVNIALKGLSDYECEYRYRRNGKEKVLWTKGIVSFNNGKPSVMKGTIMDITDRHYMLKRLERNEELYKQAQKLTHIGNWTWDLETGQFNFSDEFYRIYGLKEKEPINYDRFVSFIHPEDKSYVCDKLNHSVNTGSPHTIDFRIIRPDGSIRNIRRNVEVLIDEKGVPFKIAGTGQDITREVLLSKELKEREENFRNLIYNAPDAIVATDTTGKILLCNSKTTELFGYGQNALIGHKLSETILPGHHIRLSNTKHNQLYELKALTQTGKPIYISLNTSLSSQNGVPVFITFIRDVTDEKQNKRELEIKTNQLAELNLSLEQKNIALERTNKELTSFSYVASHDLQEPLRKIRTFINMIMEKEKTLSPESEDCFNRIVVSAGRMQTLIDDLLSFSRTQLYEKNLFDVDLNEILEEVKTSYTELLYEKKLYINSQPLPTVQAVPFQMRQLLENIINNSIKYSKKGKPTEITITSEMVEGKYTPDASPADTKMYHKISMSDKGIGFDQKYSEKIFEIFQRLHGKNEYGGTGIGLSICKKIVENHQGKINALGKIDEGAQFDIYLPA